MSKSKHSFCSRLPVYFKVSIIANINNDIVLGTIFLMDSVKKVLRQFQTSFSVDVNV